MFIFNGEGTTMQRVVNNIFSANGIYLCIIFALIAKIHKEYVTMVQESTALIEWININRLRTRSYLYIYIIYMYIILER